MPKRPFFFMLIFMMLVVLIYISSYKLIAYNNRKIAAGNILKEIEGESEQKNQFNFSVAPFVAGTYQGEAKLVDGRVANLKAFFRKHNSPLFDFADVVVEEADKNGFDYRLLPAIAMQESNVCKVIPDDSYNCWGWGIYGTTVTKFTSYDEAIATVSRGIKKEYIDKGLVTATAIMQKYTPSSNGSWAHGVNFFLQALE